MTQKGGKPMRKSLALDLFCGGGGACIGMQQAGFEVVGIDIKPHKNYPGHFIQADIHDLPVSIDDFDLIWASPPCQLWSNSGNRWGVSQKQHHPDYIPYVRGLLKGHGYSVIENVPQAPIRHDLYLWGVQVGLDSLWRKRAFELSFFCWELQKPVRNREFYYSITSSLGASNFYYRRIAEGKSGILSLTEAKHIMGIPICQEMSKLEIAESVPPAYSEYIATEALRQMTA